MMRIAWTTILGLWRDRIFLGLLALSIGLALAPVIGMLSMRQVTELTMTVCLSLISLLLLLLAVFGGTTVLWRDIERRYAFSVLSLPVRRWQIVTGKFLGLAVSILGVAALLGLVSAACILFVSGIYPPDRPISWTLFTTAVFFDALKYVLVAGLGLLLSCVSTSFFLPIFGTVVLYMVGTATQQVYEYLNSPLGGQLPETVRLAAHGLYYLLPNLSSFDLKAIAIYGLEFSFLDGLVVIAYFFGYVAVVLGLAVLAFGRREFL